MVLTVVAAAAVTNGFPPNVAAWVPGTKLSAMCRFANIAPMGTPLPSAFAIVITSGTTP